MMRAISLAVLLLLSTAPLTTSAPIEGLKYFKQKRIEPGAAFTLTLAYRGGERACVTAIGDHDPVQELAIVVTDAKGAVVATDRGKGPASDFVCAIWYPPRDGTYRIEVHNSGSIYNAVNISVR